MSFLTPIRSYVDALVHPAAQHDALTAARHRVFIAPRLFRSFAALASFPVYLALPGVPSALEIGVFSWLVVPILIVYYLSRTGRYESAHVLSSVPLECEGGRSANDPVKLVTKRDRSFPMATNDWVKKSA